ncbi:MAG TPA: GPO family capsid scaffolding protein [Lysobacter sp.]|nr:GPO family capsid scaffolding protein [Lysobacter sp.]
MHSRSDAEHRPDTVTAPSKAASMKRKSKFFRVAVEGATTDGRKIERNWLTEIAKSYNPQKYGARVFIEHIRGLNPEWGFRAMGDVVAVKTEEVEIDGEKRLALFAQIEPTEEMVKLVAAGQKIYSSIEVNPDFAGSGQAYLVGLGITDSPASLGTEVLAFAAKHPEANPFAARKQAPGNVFTVAEEAAIELEEEQPAPEPSLLSLVREMFSRRSGGDDARFADVRAAIEHLATGVTARHEEFAAQLASLSARLDALKGDHEKAIADLTGKLDHTPRNDPPRPPATGSGAAVTTDC